MGGVGQYALGAIGLILVGGDEKQHAGSVLWNSVQQVPAHGVLLNAMRTSIAATRAATISAGTSSLSDHVEAIAVKACRSSTVRGSSATAWASISANCSRIRGPSVQAVASS